VGDNIEMRVKKMQDGKIRAGCIELKIETSGWALNEDGYNPPGFVKCWEFLAERLVVYQEGHGSVELALLSKKIGREELMMCPRRLTDYNHVVLLPPRSEL
jgi:hypothetical protein